MQYNVVIAVIFIFFPFIATVYYLPVFCIHVFLRAAPNQYIFVLIVSIKRNCFGVFFFFSFFFFFNSKSVFFVIDDEKIIEIALLPGYPQ